MYKTGTTWMWYWYKMLILQLGHVFSRKIGWGHTIVLTPTEWKHRPLGNTCLNANEKHRKITNAHSVKSLKSIQVDMS